ncbi:MAG TPA: adenine phosphoribosyltransferase [Planctomycetes bacterium]|nr:adenine phosphoribosyltransferase [Planctomycetota bacterium]HIN80014.1 adenine phosphoribosyltransferase [Planctomycetota bacterium]
MEELRKKLRKKVREVSDFPKEGISFKDITPLLKDPDAFEASIEGLARIVGEVDIDIIAAPEARGFIFGISLARKLGIGFVPIRKPGKLPHDTASVSYDLEYGSDTIEIHVDAVEAGEKVLLVDDVLATGGTMKACVDLIEKLAGEVVGCAFLMELCFLGGRNRLPEGKIFSLLEETS